MVFNTTSQPEDGDLETRLFNRLERRFSGRGAYAVKMLKTAKILLAMPDQAPFIAAAAICCLRQASEEVFPQPGYNQKRWKTITDHIVSAYAHIADKDNPTCTEVGSLFSTIDELKDFKISDDKQKAKIRKLIEDSTDGSDQQFEYLLTGYNNLMRDLNDNLHEINRDVPNDTTIAICYYRRTIDMLTNIILPVWFNDIERLAKMEEPSRDDIESLNRFIENRYDLEWFISQMKSSEWLNLMDSDKLRPPSDGSTGLLPHILLNLKEEHRDAFVHLIEKNWDAWTKDDAGLCEMSHVGLRLGARGLPFVSKALRSNSSSPQLCHFAWMACRRIDAKDHHIVELAGMLLHPNSALEDYQVNDIAEKLVDGIDRQSSETRITVLVLQLRNTLTTNAYHFFPTGSIAKLVKIIPSVHTYLAANLCSALKKAHTLGKLVPNLIDYLDPLPQDIRSRFVAWLFSHIGKFDCSRNLDFLVSNCLSRDPTGDDVLLLEQLEQDCNTEIISSRLTDAIGAAPSPEEFDSILQSRSSHPRYKIVKWVAIIGDRINLVGWETCRRKLSALELTRETLRNHPVVSTRPTNLFSQTEFDSTEFKDLEEKIASLTPAAECDLALPKIYAIRSALEAAIRKNPDKWAHEPMKIVRALRHPMYISSYFRALAAEKSTLYSYASVLIHSVEFAGTHPYHVIPLSQSPYYDDHNWNDTDIAGMSIIRELVRSDADLDQESLARMWRILLNVKARQANRLSNASGETINDIEGYLSADLNYSYPCALHVTLFLIQFAKKRDHAIPKEVWKKLREPLLRTDSIGAECRAVFATNVGLLRSVVPDWLERNEPLLFGTDAPINMTKLSLHMHLMADNPDECILERYRSGVLDAVRENVGRAMSFLMLGMLWGIDGYNPESVAKSLVEMQPRHISLAGKTTAEMLRGHSHQDSISLGVNFWHQILDLSQMPEALRGYGRWYCVTAIEQDKWEQLMLQTCEKANGKIDFAGEVAERISLYDRVTDSGLTILKLLLQDSWNSFDKEIVADYAWATLNKSRSNPEIEESWHLLRAILQERGYRQLSS